MKMHSADLAEDAFERNKEELLTKGDLDLRNAVISLMQVQSAIFLYAVKRDISDVLEHFEGFQSEIKGIDKASSDISAISFKTRMLSINAAIEAAHAGNAGKGFGVVAVEIGTLSKQTKQCNDEVSNINQSMLARAGKNQETLDELENRLRRFSVSNQQAMGDILRLSSIEENGFIITTLAKRLENHADFMRNLLANAGKTEKLSDHHSCAFGKWYDQHKEKYKNMPEYEAIYDTHKEFHSVAIEFNKTMELGALMRFLELSQEIMNKFVMLAEAFKREMKRGPSTQRAD